MMRARALAALVAVAMVVGAIVVRSEVIDGGGGGGAGGGDTPAVCARELPDGVCGAGNEEALAATVDRLIETNGADLRWITPGPFPQMVNEARAAASQAQLFSTISPIASTELVAVVLRKPPQCPAEVTWRCLGDALGAGERVSAPPRGTATRLLATAALVGGRLDRTDYASNDFTDDTEVADWLSEAHQGIEQTRRFSGATELRGFLAARGAAAGVFITTAAEAAAAGAQATTVKVPTPAARVIAYGGTTGRADFGSATEALEGAGWSTDATSLEGDAGLPSPGVLLALREVGS